jgi:hypothetical protein
VLAGERARRQQPVQPLVKRRVLKPVTCDEREDAVERQHALKAAGIQRARQKVGQQQRAGQRGQHVGVQLEQHLVVWRVRGRARACGCGGVRV